MDNDKLVLEFGEFLKDVKNKALGNKNSKKRKEFIELSTMCLDVFLTGQEKLNSKPKKRQRTHKDIMVIKPGTKNTKKGTTVMTEKESTKADKEKNHV